MVACKVLTVPYLTMRKESVAQHSTNSTYTVNSTLRHISFHFVYLESKNSKFWNPKRPSAFGDGTAHPKEAAWWEFDPDYCLDAAGGVVKLQTCNAQPTQKIEFVDYALQPLRGCEQVQLMPGLCVEMGISLFQPGDPLLGICAMEVYSRSFRESSGCCSCTCWMPLHTTATHTTSGGTCISALHPPDDNNLDHSSLCSIPCPPLSTSWSQPLRQALHRGQDGCSSSLCPWIHGIPGTGASIKRCRRWVMLDSRPANARLTTCPCPPVHCR